MPRHGELEARKPPRYGNLSRLNTLADAIFAFALTLLALDLKLPVTDPNALAQVILTHLPKLLVFVFAFLVIAQEWDVHQRTLLHIDHTDGIFTWLYLLSLMFVVLMPVSAELLGRYPLQAWSLVFFGLNTAFFCLTSWGLWQYASHGERLLEGTIQPGTVRMISRLWLYPPIIILLTIPVGFISVYPVYLIWVLMPVLSYAYSAWFIRSRIHKQGK